MKKLIAICMVFASCAVMAEARTFTDAEVSDQFVAMTKYFCINVDRGNPISTGLRSILDICCSGDTNRYVRIAKETATSDTNFICMAMNIVAKHGTSDDLPFLYQYTNNVEYSWRSLLCILDLEGVTSNSVLAVKAFLDATDPEWKSEREMLALTLLNYASKSSTSGGVKALARDVVIDYSLRLFGVNDVDEALIRLDPGYKFSKRRLHVLRTDLARGLEPYPQLYNYVTNAISELVAYPEANLPD